MIEEMMVEGAMVVAGMVTKAGAVMGGCYGVYRAVQAMPSGRSKRDLKRCFDLGTLYLPVKRGKQEKRVYPKILEIKEQIDRMTAVFTLPAGVDPKLVHRHTWLFHQVFGPNVDIKGDTKTFTVTAYSDVLNMFDYDYEAVSGMLEKLKLPILVGKSLNGFEAYDMVEHPHLLIAGETGSGKSVCLRQILTTLIQSVPNLELYCADMKRSEFHLFRRIAQEVVMDAGKLKLLLLKLKKELRRRGDLLDAAEEAHIDDLPDPPPYIVLAVDEVALLKKEKDCMEMIEDISAIGRALGVYLILSMQRPDAQVLDGKLKNNLTVRLAFRHADEINSRITIGTGEAAGIDEDQKGRMIYKRVGLTTVQVPYLELGKAKTILADYKRPVPKGEPIDIEHTVVVEEDEKEDMLNVL